MVSMGKRETFPFMKCDRILDLTDASRPAQIPSPIASGIGLGLSGVTSTGVLLLGTLV